jgi:hypothetical protein
MAINYQVKQGDCIYSIAVEHGFFADTIWNDPNNAELKKKRQDPNVLMPGDTVFIRDKQIKEVSEPTNQVHKFRCKNTPKKLRIQLKYIDTPLKNTDYKIDIDGVEKEGKTDSEGWLTQSLVPNAKVAVIRLEDGSEFEMKLGNLDPIDEVSGIQGRLHDLGFYSGSINGQMNEETENALKIFQHFNDLEASGKADEATKNLLIEMTAK